MPSSYLDGDGYFTPSRETVPDNAPLPSPPVVMPDDTLSGMGLPPSLSPLESNTTQQDQTPTTDDTLSGSGFGPSAFLGGSPPPVPNFGQQDFYNMPSGSAQSSDIGVSGAQPSNDLGGMLGNWWNQNMAKPIKQANDFWTNTVDPISKEAGTDVGKAAGILANPVQSIADIAEGKNAWDQAPDVFGRINDVSNTLGQAAQTGTQNQMFLLRPALSLLGVDVPKNPLELAGVSPMEYKGTDYGVSMPKPDDVDQTTWDRSVNWWTHDNVAKGLQVAAQIPNFAAQSGLGVVGFIPSLIHDPTGTAHGLVNSVGQAVQFAQDLGDPEKRSAMSGSDLATGFSNLAMVGTMVAGGIHGGIKLTKGMLDSRAAKQDITYSGRAANPNRVLDQTPGEDTAGYSGGNPSPNRVIDDTPGEPTSAHITQALDANRALGGSAETLAEGVRRGKIAADKADEVAANLNIEGWKSLGRPVPEGGFDPETELQQRLEWFRNKRQEGNVPNPETGAPKPFDDNGNMSQEYLDWAQRVGGGDKATDGPSTLLPSEDTRTGQYDRNSIGVNNAYNRALSEYAKDNNTTTDRAHEEVGYNRSILDPYINKYYKQGLLTQEEYEMIQKNLKGLEHDKSGYPYDTKDSAKADLSPSRDAMGEGTRDVFNPQNPEDDRTITGLDGKPKLPISKNLDYLRETNSPRYEVANPDVPTGDRLNSKLSNLGDGSHLPFDVIERRLDEATSATDDIAHKMQTGVHSAKNLARLHENFNDAIQYQKKLEDLYHNHPDNPNSRDNTIPDAKGFGYNNEVLDPKLDRDLDEDSVAHQSAPSADFYYSEMARGSMSRFHGDLRAATTDINILVDIANGKDAAQAYADHGGPKKSDTSFSKGFVLSQTAETARASLNHELNAIRGAMHDTLARINGTDIVAQEEGVEPKDYSPEFQAGIQEDLEKYNKLYDLHEETTKALGQKSGYAPDTGRDSLSSNIQKLGTTSYLDQLKLEGKVKVLRAAQKKLVDFTAEQRRNLVTNFATAAHNVAAITDYGSRTFKVSEPGFVASWSNGGESWGVSVNKKIVTPDAPHGSYTDGRPKPGDTLLLEANETFIPAKTRWEADLIAQQLNPLPLYANSFEYTKGRSMDEIPKGSEKDYFEGEMRKAQAAGKTDLSMGEIVKSINQEPIDRMAKMRDDAILDFHKLISEPANMVKKFTPSDNSDLSAHGLPSPTELSNRISKLSQQHLSVDEYESGNDFPALVKALGKPSLRGGYRIGKDPSKVGFGIILPDGTSIHMKNHIDGHTEAIEESGLIGPHGYDGFSDSEREALNLHPTTVMDSLVSRGAIRVASPTMMSLPDGSATSLGTASKVLESVVNDKSVPDHRLIGIDVLHHSPKDPTDPLVAHGKSYTFTVGDLRAHDGNLAKAMRNPMTGKADLTTNLADTGRAKILAEAKDPSHKIPQAVLDEWGVTHDGHLLETEPDRVSNKTQGVDNNANESTSETGQEGHAYQALQAGKADASGKTVEAGNANSPTQSSAIATPRIPDETHVTLREAPSESTRTLDNPPPATEASIRATAEEIFDRGAGEGVKYGEDGWAQVDKESLLPKIIDAVKQQLAKVGVGYYADRARSIVKIGNEILDRVDPLGLISKVQLDPHSNDNAYWKFDQPDTIFVNPRNSYSPLITYLHANQLMYGLQGLRHEMTQPAYDKLSFYIHELKDATQEDVDKYMVAHEAYHAVTFNYLGAKNLMDFAYKLPRMPDEWLLHADQSGLPVLEFLQDLRSIQDWGMNHNGEEAPRVLEGHVLSQASLFAEHMVHQMMTYNKEPLSGYNHTSLGVFRSEILDPELKEHGAQILGKLIDTYHREQLSSRPTPDSVKSRFEAIQSGGNRLNTKTTKINSIGDSAGYSAGADQGSLASKSQSFKGASMQEALAKFIAHQGQSAGDMIMNIIRNGWDADPMKFPEALARPEGDPLRAKAQAVLAKLPSNAERGKWNNYAQSFMAPEDARPTAFTGKGTTIESKPVNTSSLEKAFARRKEVYDNKISGMEDALNRAKGLPESPEKAAIVEKHQDDLNFVKEVREHVAAGRTEREAEQLAKQAIQAKLEATRQEVTKKTAPDFRGAAEKPVDVGMKYGKPDAKVASVIVNRLKLAGHDDPTNLNRFFDQVRSGDKKAVAIFSKLGPKTKKYLNELIGLGPRASALPEVPKFETAQPRAATPRPVDVPGAVPTSPTARVPEINIERVAPTPVNRERISVEQAKQAVLVAKQLGAPDEHIKKLEQEYKDLQEAHEAKMGAGPRPRNQATFNKSKGVARKAWSRVASGTTIDTAAHDAAKEMGMTGLDEARAALKGLADGTDKRAESWHGDLKQLIQGKFGQAVDAVKAASPPLSTPVSGLTHEDLLGSGKPTSTKPIVNKTTGKAVKPKPVPVVVDRMAKTVPNPKVDETPVSVQKIADEAKVNTNKGKTDAEVAAETKKINEAANTPSPNMFNEFDATGLNKALDELVAESEKGVDAIRQLQKERPDLFGKPVKAGKKGPKVTEEAAKIAEAERVQAGNGGGGDDGKAGGGSGGSGGSGGDEDGPIHDGWVKAHQALRAIGGDHAEFADHLDLFLKAWAKRLDPSRNNSHPIEMLRDFIHSVVSGEYRAENVYKAMAKMLPKDKMDMNDRILKSVDMPTEEERLESLRNLDHKEAAIANALHHYWRATGKIATDPNRAIFKNFLEQYLPHVIERDEEGATPRLRSGGYSKGTVHAIERARDEITGEFLNTGIADLNARGIKTKTYLPDIWVAHGRAMSRASRMREMIHDMQNFVTFVEREIKGRSFQGSPIVNREVYKTLSQRDQDLMRPVALGRLKTTMDGMYVYRPLADVMERLSRTDEGGNAASRVANVLSSVNQVYKVYKFGMNPLHIYNLLGNFGALGTGKLDVLGAASPLMYKNIFGRVNELLKTPEGKDVIARGISRGLTPPRDIVDNANLGAVQRAMDKYVPGFHYFHNFVWHEIAWKGQVGTWLHMTDVYTNKIEHAQGRKLTPEEVVEVEKQAAFVAKTAAGFLDKLDQTKDWNVFMNGINFANSWSTMQLRALGGATGVGYLRDIGGGERYTHSVTDEMANAGFTDASLKHINGMTGQMARKLMFGGMVRLMTTAMVTSIIGSYLYSGGASVSSPIDNFKRDPIHTFDIYQGEDPVTHKNKWLVTQMYGMQKEVTTYALAAVKAWIDGKDPATIALAPLASYSNKLNPSLRLTIDDLFGIETGKWVAGYADKAFIDNDKNLQNIRKSLDAQGIPDFGSTEDRLLYTLRELTSPGLPPPVNNSNMNWMDILKSTGGGQALNILPTGVDQVQSGSYAGGLVKGAAEIATGTRETESSTHDQIQTINDIQAKKQETAARDEQIKLMVDAASKNDMATVLRISQQLGMSAKQTKEALLFPPAGSGGGLAYRGEPYNPNKDTTMETAIYGHTLSNSESSNYQTALKTNQLNAIQALSGTEPFMNADGNARLLMINNITTLVDKATKEQFAQSIGLRGGATIKDSDITQLASNSFKLNSLVMPVLINSKEFNNADPLSRNTMKSEYTTFANTLAWDYQFGALKGATHDQLTNILQDTIVATEGAKNYLRNTPFFTNADTASQDAMIAEYSSLARSLAKKEALGQGQGQFSDEILKSGDLVPVLQSVINTEESAKAILHQTDFYMKATPEVQKSLDSKYSGLARTIAISGANSPELSSLANTTGAYKNGPDRAILGEITADEAISQLQDKYGGRDYIVGAEKDLTDLKKLLREQTNASPRTITYLERVLTSRYLAQNEQYANYLKAKTLFQRNSNAGRLSAALNNSEYSLADSLVSEMLAQQAPTDDTLPYDPTTDPYSPAFGTGSTVGGANSTDYDPASDPTSSEYDPLQDPNYVASV